jgi:pimeloyl-ACP methyl ester carboxylesterase
MMHFQRYGGGECSCAALHGWGGSHQTFAPLARHVPPGVSLFAADLPGYGRSPRLAAATADAVAETIAESIAGLPGDRVTLVGNCSGAIFALLAAPLLGPRLDRLVLIDPFAFVPWYFKVFIHPAYGRYAYYSTFANPVGRWLTNLSLRRQRASSTDLTASFTGVDHEVSLQYLEMLDALGDIRRFRDVTVPIDIAYGERTFAAVKQSLGAWQQVLPHARIWQVDGAGHLPIEEAPGRVAAIVFGAARAAGKVA